MKQINNFTGEFIGTFILVFFGCGSVAVSVLFSALTGLLQVAAVWGIAVALAIYATRHLSCAHLNPAVTLAMVVGQRMKLKALPLYWGAQLLGAAGAAGALYGLFASSIAHYELLHGITRGAPESIQTAMIFGEFYPNPGMSAIAKVSMTNAFMAEAMGTFALVFLIFSLTEGCNVGRPDSALAPLFIGLAVTIIIVVIAPLTQAGLNPARDLAPRLFAYLAGWKEAALPDQSYGFMIVYVLGPLLGGTLAALFFTKCVQPQMDNLNQNKGCDC